MQFSKGQSGNPNGRPKGAKGLGAMLKAQAEKDSEVDPDKSSLQLVAEKLIKKAVEGDLAAITILFDRIDGKPLQSIAIANEDEMLGAMDDEALSSYYAQETAELAEQEGIGRN